MSDERLIDADEAMSLQCSHSGPGKMLIWTVYANPPGHINWYIARPHAVPDDPTLNVYMRARTLRLIRHLLPMRGPTHYLSVMPRAPHDKDDIIETWVP